jgi:membrane-bound lytic murein transglycosylase B
MQFLAGTWAQYGRGGNRYDPADAIPAAARLLCANGLQARHPPDRCPALDGTPGEHTAIYAYNHACWYVRQVLTFARSYEHGGR